VFEIVAVAATNAGGFNRGTGSLDTKTAGGFGLATNGVKGTLPGEVEIGKVSGVGNA
jgi:hypothetical protein